MKEEPKEEIDLPFQRLICKRCESNRLEILGVTSNLSLLTTCISCGQISYILKETIKYPSEIIEVKRSSKPSMCG